MVIQHKTSFRLHEQPIRDCVNLFIMKNEIHANEVKTKYLEKK